MSLHPLRNSPASAAGAWKLPPGRALSLQAREPGRLQIARGAVWATLDGPSGDQPDPARDRVLRAGEHLELRPGQRAVLEPLARGSSAWFRWQPHPAPARVSAAQALGEPWRQLRTSSLLAAQALGALVLGLVRLVLPARRAVAAGAPCCEGVHG